MPTLPRCSREPTPRRAMDDSAPLLTFAGVPLQARFEAGRAITRIEAPPGARLDPARVPALYAALRGQPVLAGSTAVHLHWPDADPALREALVRSGGYPEPAEGETVVRLTLGALPAGLRYRRHTDVPWHDVRGGSLQTLCFIVSFGRVLLIEKRRGHGAGGVNGPGGKAEAGETARQCAIRETIEEVCLRPLAVRCMGLIHFQYADGRVIDGRIFRADGALGVPRETEEARPFWVGIDAIPWQRMWDDDVLWLPHLIAGAPFRAELLIHDDRLVSHRIELLAALPD